MERTKQDARLVERPGPGQQFDLVEPEADDQVARGEDRALDRAVREDAREPRIIVRYDAFAFVTHEGRQPVALAERANCRNVFGPARTEPGDDDGFSGLTEHVVD